MAYLYAHSGYPSAQLTAGQRYLKGAGVVKDGERAMHCLRQASKQDHPCDSFNLAVGKVKTMTSSIEVSLLFQEASTTLKTRQRRLVTCTPFVLKLGESCL